MCSFIAELDGLRRKLTKLLSPEAKAIAVEWQVICTPATARQAFSKAVQLEKSAAVACCKRYVHTRM